MDGLGSLGAKALDAMPDPLVRPTRAVVVRLRRLGLSRADAVVASYPKSGSTWLRFLLAHALTGEESDFDRVRTTIPPVGRHRRAPALLAGDGRVTRTHEPFDGPGSPGTRPLLIHLVRDGRAVALSYLAHQRRYDQFDGGADDFVDAFLAGTVDNYGPWHEHVLAAEGRLQRAGGRVLRVRYEDLRAAPEAELARVLAFLGFSPGPGPGAEGRGVGPAWLAEVVAANTKDRMRAKEASSAFMASHRTDGTPFVRPDSGPTWDEVVGKSARARFEAVCAPALLSAGYAVAGGAHAG